MAITSDIAMDAMAICIRAKPETSLSFKVKVHLGRMNIASPQPIFGQDYFVVSSKKETCQWVDGVAVQLEPYRALRQFIALPPGTG